MKRRRLPSDTQNCGPPEIDYTKLPARCLLKTSDLPGPKDAKLWNEVLLTVLPVDVLLLTVEDWEFLSCVSHLNPGYFRSSHGNLGTVYFGQMGTGPTFLKIAVMKCHSGPLTPGGALITVKNGVEVLRPKAVFCVGFCGGLGQEVSLGDVAISAKLRTYASVKVTNSGIQERGFAVPLEANLLKLINHADNGWKAPLRDPPVVKVWKDGVYLSGPEKVESKERREELVKRFRDAIAIDMEGQGESLAKVWQRDCSVFRENSPSGEWKSTPLNYVWIPDPPGSSL